MNPKYLIFRRPFIPACIGLAVSLSPSVGLALGIWNSVNGGNWSDTSATGWNSTPYPSAPSAVARFNNKNITADVTITVDVTDAEAGTLTIADTDTTSPGNFIIAGVNPLTLARTSGAVQVASSTGSNIISAPIVLGSGTFITVTGTQLELSNTISDGGAAQQLTLNNTSTGILKLSGVNTYTGVTTVSGGTLVVAGSTHASSSVFVTGVLAGAGTVNGSVTLNSGSKISPGNAAGPATLNTGGETWKGGASYGWDINSASATFGAGKGASTGYDFLNITGGLNLANLDTTANRFTVKVTSLDGTNNPGSAAGFDGSLSYDWVLATTTTGITGFNSGDFIVDASAFTNLLNGGTFSVLQGGSIDGSTANDLILHFQAVPEPSGMGLLGLGAGWMLKRRRPKKPELDRA